MHLNFNSLAELFFCLPQFYFTLYPLPLTLCFTLR